MFVIEMCKSPSIGASKLIRFRISNWSKGLDICSWMCKLLLIIFVVFLYYDEKVILFIKLRDGFHVNKPTLLITDLGLFIRKGSILDLILLRFEP